MTSRTRRHARSPQVRRVRVACVVAVVLGCSRPPPDEPRCSPPADVAEQARTVRRALLDRDLVTAQCSIAERTPPRIEIHMKLAETDERELREGTAGLRSVLDELTGARWPHGLAATDVARCFGDCCDFTVSSLAPGALHLRRLCFASREGGSRKLSLATFVEAR